ncbi:MAG: hypothetical protein B9J98_00865 [Candidatus Terraquivivens tikiterensis]|uniref:Uncharacterized protein n=1 Tax=Candidatus Terraquivivens tikiterensis TaxID=1980982 RepID=A0A2R7Y9K8_9ARCH|nr:MAG: hypothetical protein B9J98_00865 [Candidatus Terraquivivens tikiterensis]
MGKKPKAFPAFGPRGLLSRLAPLALTLLACLSRMKTVHASVGDLVGKLSGALEGIQSLILMVGMGLLAAGLLLRFLPTGSFKTKEAGGQLIDHALILAGLGALGVWLLWFAADVAVSITGTGEAPQPSGPWSLPSR